ncbi:hypothetical protein PAF17_15925 [Paracoccus sp. Z330]|uniref:Uncharacterized protein n=1 Tax=Paracoccus onchidii TaxID=3017813 RepID=A0ABT4ZJT7_9RHOB|nr:hypothetical protein [Paracoccus onchidii]MDB6178980.1 hypothetical protein [Paracoccus onchidii]
MTPHEQSIAFVRAARGASRTLPEIADAAGLTLDQAREVLARGVQAKRLRVNDSDRQNIIIEVIS